MWPPPWKLMSGWREIWAAGDSDEVAEASCSVAVL